MSIEYAVQVEQFAGRHFIRSFKKKYRSSWDITWIAVEREFKAFDELLKTNIAETIVDRGGVRICKTEFRVAGTQESRHGSGNRCIVAVHKNLAKVCVLLVYGKNDISTRNETAEWKKIVAENYPEYGDICK